MTNPFTPEQVSQILEEFFKVVGTRQYIGARYVPIFGRKGEESIEWDNSAPYEPLTIVLYQGNSYTSRQYVPVGVEITNQEFWAITGNYNAQIEQYRKEVRDILPYDETPTEGSTKGVTSDGVKKAIDTAEQTNATAIANEVTRAKEAEQTNATAIAAEITARTTADTNLSERITTNTNNIATVLPMDTTPTQESSKGITSGGVYEAIENYTGPIKSALDLGMDNTGSTDISAIFNEQTKEYAIYFPAGTYKVSNTLKPIKSVLGAFPTRPQYHKQTTYEINDGTIFMSEMASGNIIYISPSLPFTMKNITIVCNSNETGIDISGSNMTVLDYVNIVNISNTGIYIHDGISRCTYIYHCYMSGCNDYVNNIGININKSPDCRIDNFECMSLHTGISIYESLIQINNAHIWGGNTNTDTTPSTDYVSTLRGITFQQGTILILNNVYIDTYYTGLFSLGGWANTISMSNIVYLNDTTYMNVDLHNYAFFDFNGNADRIKLSSGFIRTSGSNNNNFQSEFEVFRFNIANNIAVQNAINADYILSSDSNTLPNKRTVNSRPISIYKTNYIVAMPNTTVCLAQTALSNINNTVIIPISRYNNNPYRTITITHTANSTPTITIDASEPSIKYHVYDNNTVGIYVTNRESYYIPYIVNINGFAIDSNKLDAGIFNADWNNIPDDLTIIPTS